MFIISDIYYHYEKYAVIEGQITNMTVLGLTPLLFEDKQDEYCQCSLVIRPYSKVLAEIRLGIDVLPPNYSVNYRSRNSFFGNFIMDGGGILNGETFKKGDFFYTDPNVKNRIMSAPEGTLRSFWFQIRGSFAKDLVQKLSHISPLRIMSYRTEIDIERFFRFMLESEGVVNENEQFAKGIVDILLSFISFGESGDACDPTALPRSARIAQRAMRMMDESYSEISIEKLAEMLHINRKYLCNEFKAATGINPQSYLIKCKLRGAATYLSETDYPIKKIVELVGYNHRNSFTTAFHRIYGCTPTDYRKRNSQR